MTGNPNRKRAADKDSRKGLTQRKKRKAPPWTDKLKDEPTLRRSDLTNNEEDYDDYLNPAAHIIH